MVNYCSVAPPANLTPEDEHLFLPHLRYSLEKQKILRLKKVFITYSGLCVNNKGIIRECHHRHPEYYNGYAASIEAYQKGIEKEPGNLVILDDDQTYLAVFHPWYNYYHWICESIFRLWLVRDHLREMILILPDFYKNSDFIMGSLTPFQFKDIFFIPTGKSLLVRNLCLPQIKPLVDSYDPQALREVRKFYLDTISLPGTGQINLGKRLYISRKKAARKKIANEEQVEDILKRHGFTTINNEDYSFLDQISIFSHAEQLVSIHGSGLTNMLFMPNNSSVLEFHKARTNDQDWHSRAFWYLADALGHKYYHQLCMPTDSSSTYFTADLLVDTDKLQRNIALILD